LIFIPVTPYGYLFGGVEVEFVSDSNKVQLDEVYGLQRLDVDICNKLVILNNF
jgi:hypothetical protein